MRVMRRIVDASTQTLGWMRRNRRVETHSENGPVCINLGCGLAVAPSWINIDGSLNALAASLPPVFHRLAYRFSGAANYYSREQYLTILGNHIFVHHDLKYGLPLHNESIDFIYSSHFLEHLPKAAARKLLEESFRVLRPGGLVRVIVPDLEYAISLYGVGRSGEMLSQYFFVSDDGSYFAQHKYMYDFCSLGELLSDIGFRDVVRCEYQCGDTPDLVVLDNRPDDSLYVEARK